MTPREWSVTFWVCAESGWERDVEIHKQWDLCLCGGGGGGCGSGVGGGVASSDGGDGGSGVDGSGGNSGVGAVEVLCSVRMGVGVGGVGNRGGGELIGGGNASVADGGADGGGARWRDCCRFPDGIFGELWEDLPYRVPFTLDISDFFL